MFNIRPFGPSGGLATQPGIVGGRSIVAGVAPTTATQGISPFFIRYLTDLNRLGVPRGSVVTVPGTLGQACRNRQARVTDNNGITWICREDCFRMMSYCTQE